LFEGEGRFLRLFLEMGALDEFKATLRSIANESGQNQIHLAALGSRVRLKLPGFSPTHYGYSSFTDLVKSCTDIGEVRFGKRSEDRWFIFGDGGQIVESTISNHEIVKSVWDACVELDDTRRAWLDFADFNNIELAPEVVSAEPERYIELPRFGRGHQLELLREFSAIHEDHTALAKVIETWSSEGASYWHLVEALQGLGLRHSWFAHLRRAVEDALQVWADVHGIPTDALFKPKQSRPQKHVRVDSEQPRFGDEVELRAFLKAAIDEMTLVELGQLPIPARLLLKQRPQ
jgi:hypothetical protein